MKILDFVGNSPWLIWLALVLGIVSIVSLVLLFVVNRKRHQLALALAGQDAYVQRLLGEGVKERDIEIARLQSTVGQLELGLKEKRAEVDALRASREELLQLQVRWAERERQVEESEQQLKEAREVLLKEFELSASKMFDSKQHSFEKRSRAGMESVLMPFREQLKIFGERVTQAYESESAQRNQLVGKIVELQRQTVRISADADNLARALKGDNKLQGNWGEMILERVLELSGLVRGREYLTQPSYKQADGRLLRPDVVIQLPQTKHMVVDAKVSLVEYEKYWREQDASVRAECAKKHLESFRRHIRGLAEKRYFQAEGLNSLDFVFMFVPIEGAFQLAIDSAPELLGDALSQKVLLVSPSSVMVSLRSVEALWRQHRQNENAEKIAESAGKLYDQFALVVQAVEDLGGGLTRTSDAYNSLVKRLSEGRGNAFKRVADLKHLGAKASRILPEGLEERDIVLKKVERVQEGVEDK